VAGAVIAAAAVVPRRGPAAEAQRRRSPAVPAVAAEAQRRRSPAVAAEAQRRRRSPAVAVVLGLRRSPSPAVPRRENHVRARAPEIEFKQGQSQLL